MILICTKCGATNHLNTDRAYKCRKCSNINVPIVKVKPKKDKPKACTIDNITTMNDNLNYNSDENYNPINNEEELDNE